MQITLYSGFKKKRNSTKQPGSGQSSMVLTGTLKENCSVLNPVIRINRVMGDVVPQGFTYAYIPDFDRYYFVTGVAWSKPFWEISMTVDVLASHKAQIGLSSHYVLRTDSTTDFNPQITDTMYPATNDIDLYQISLNSTFVSNISNGTYIVGIISGNDSNAVGAISYYAMSASEFGDLKEALLSDNNLITMGMAESDGQGGLAPLINDMSLEMLKAMYNPYQYIASCMWFPFPKSAITSTAVTHIKIGWWNYSLNGNIINAQNLVLREGPTAIHRHPAAASRGSYLNYAPYTKCTVYGIYGSTPIDLTYFDQDDDTLILHYIVDLITGQCRVRFESYQSSESSPHYHVLCEKDFLCGVPIQLAQIATDYLGAAVTAVDATASTVQNAMTLNIGGAISSAAHGIYNTLNATMPQLATSGTNGSFMITDDYLKTTFSYQHFNLTDEDITHKGRPLCEIRQINTLSGYILCSDGDFDISCMDEERGMITDFLTSGFFWE